MKNVYTMFIQDDTMTQETFFGVANNFETVMQIIYDRLGTVIINYAPKAEIWTFYNQKNHVRILVEKTMLMTNIYKHNKEP